jgi:hypothetical protein
LEKNIIRITDKVTNFGFQASPYTILYHMNLGYPLLCENSQLIIDPVQTQPRDETAISGLNEFKQFIKPQAGYQEQVFYHTMKGNAKGETDVTLQNKKLGIALTIKFNISQLPYLTQWKMMGQGEYVLGLEPCNVPGKNRKVLRDENILPFLQSGESKTNLIEVIVTDISNK